MSVDPNDGMDALRKMEAAKAEHDIVSAMVFPSGRVPQVAIDDKKMYPLYMKCVELDIPMCINGGIVGPAHAELAAVGRAASTRSATTSPSSPS